MTINRKLVSKFNIFLAAVFIAAIGVRFYYSDQSATAGEELKVYQNKIDLLEKESEILQNKYYELTAISNIKETALLSGYISASVDYYSSPSLASR